MSGKFFFIKQQKTRKKTVFKQN